VGDELSEVDGSAVEGTGVTSLGLPVGAAFELLEPASAAIAEPSAMGASASSRPERAAERRLALLPLISAVMGVALNKRESAAAVVVIFMLKSLEFLCGFRVVVRGGRWLLVLLLCDACIMRQGAGRAQRIAWKASLADSDCLKTSSTRFLTRLLKNLSSWRNW